MAIQDDKLQKFLASQERAKRLIQMDRNGELDKYSNKHQQTYNNNINTINENKISNSKLPKEIIDSFKTSQIINDNNVSILDEINHLTNGELYVKENKNDVEKNDLSDKIDYSMIKMIVESTMKKYMGALKKSLLTENINSSNNNVNIVQFGDKFNFVTKNGDLYEAQLKFIKNIKK